MQFFLSKMKLQKSDLDVDAEARKDRLSGGTLSHLAQIFTKKSPVKFLIFAKKRENVVENLPNSCQKYIDKNNTDMTRNSAKCYLTKSKGLFEASKKAFKRMTKGITFVDLKAALIKIREKTIIPFCPDLMRERADDLLTKRKDE